MSIIRIAGVALIACAAAVVVRQLRPELGIFIPIAAAVVIFIYAISELCGIIDGIFTRLQSYGIDAGYISVLIKCLGIAYTAQTATDICRDAGESAIASKAELCGRVMILACCIPVVSDLLDMLDEVLAMI